METQEENSQDRSRELSEYYCHVVLDRPQAVDITEYFSSLERSFFTEFEDRAGSKNLVQNERESCIVIFKRSGIVLTERRYRHSTTRPALVLSEPCYYLFGFRFTQQVWFRILGYTPEEQLLHILQWGRHA